MFILMPSLFFVPLFVIHAFACMRTPIYLMMHLVIHLTVDLIILPFIWFRSDESGSEDEDDDPALRKLES